ncbi:RIP metalloprotease RseP [Alteribacillus sp. HJP-4]|uniref:RIP metalloprotease RseP n=1 Tax=Alteribacillus sp. HJP-4 TaxID=2775394 RepID=UPI0035CD38E8
MDTFIAIIIIFGVLVAVHEWGHLYFAKKAGILCREFAIGFGPKIFSTKKNETVYTLRLLPLGGFVRMAGEEPEAVQIKPGYEVGLVFDQMDQVSRIIVNNKSKHPEAKVVSVERIDLEKDLYVQAYSDDEAGLKTYQVHEKCELVLDEKPEQIAPLDRQFGSKKPGQKALAIFAGPLMNFLLAFVLLFAFGMINGVPQPDASLGELTDGGAAEEAGLREGDEVRSIAGQEVSDWEEMTRAIQEYPEEEIDFQIVRDGESMTIPVTPERNYDENADREFGFIGANVTTTHSPLEAVEFGAVQVYEVTVLIFDVLGMIITGEFSLDYLSGPVGIYSATGEVQSLGMILLLQWAAMLSVNLGIVNLLPLPALDGGRLIFIGLEAVRGKPIDPQKEGLVHFVGFALLFLLMLVVTWNDINQFFL